MWGSSKNSKEAGWARAGEWVEVVKWAREGGRSKSRRASKSMVGTGFYSNVTRSQWKVLTAGVTWSSLLGCSGRRSLVSKSRRRQVSGKQWLRLDDVAWIAVMVVEVVGREFGETLGEPSIKDYPRGWMEVWEEEWDIILCSCRPTGGFHLFILFLFMAGVRTFPFCPHWQPF